MTKGDSGGGIYLKDQTTNNEKFICVGIFSYGYGCGTPGWAFKKKNNLTSFHFKPCYKFPVDCKWPKSVFQDYNLKNLAITEIIFVFFLEFQYCKLFVEKLWKN